MHLDLAVGAHRHLGGCGGIAPIAHKLRDAAMHPRGQRLAPIALLRARSARRDVSDDWLMSSRREFQRVTAGRRAPPPHEAFEVHAVLVGVDPAPGPTGTWVLRIAYSICRLGKV